MEWQEVWEGVFNKAREELAEMKVSFSKRRNLKERVMLELKTINLV